MALNQRHNICRATDAYKITQVGLDPTRIEFIMEYMNARGGRVCQKPRSDSPGFQKCIFVLPVDELAPLLDVAFPSPNFTFGSW